MAFQPWTNITPVPATVTGAYPRLAIEFGKAALPVLRSQRNLNPRSWGVIPGQGGFDYLPLDPLAAWDLIFANPENPLNRLPDFSFPAGTPLTFGATVRYRFNGQEFTENTGRFVQPPPAPTVDFYAPIREGVKLINPQPGRWQYVFSASDFNGQPIEVPISSNFSFSNSSPIRLEELQVYEVAQGQAIPLRSNGIGLSPSTGPVPEIVPVTVPMPAVPGLAPFPSDWPYIVIEPSRLPTRPVPMLPAPELPEPLRRALPPVFIYPDGIQVGINDPSDRIIVIPSDMLNRYPQTQTQPQLLPVPPTPTLCLDTPEPPGDCCSCDEIRDIVAEELDSKFPPARPNNLNTIVYGEANSRVINLPEFTLYVRIQLIDIPVNAKRQPGDNAPDVIYAGWCAYGFDAFGGERLPVHYALQELPAPVGAGTFSYTLYNGYTAAVTVYYLQET